MESELVVVDNQPTIDKQLPGQSDSREMSFADDFNILKIIYRII